MQGFGVHVLRSPDFIISICIFFEAFWQKLGRGRVRFCLLRLVSCESRNGKDNGNYYNGLYRHYSKVPFLHCQRTKGKVC